MSEAVTILGSQERCNGRFAYEEPNSLQSRFLNQSVSVGNERNELSVLHLRWLHVVLWHSGYRLHSTTVAVLFVGNSSPGFHQLNICSMCTVVSLLFGIHFKVTYHGQMWIAQR